MLRDPKPCPAFCPGLLGCVCLVGTLPAPTFRRCATAPGSFGHHGWAHRSPGHPWVPVPGWPSPRCLWGERAAAMCCGASALSREEDRGEAAPACSMLLVYRLSSPPPLARCGYGFCSFFFLFFFFFFGGKHSSGCALAQLRAPVTLIVISIQADKNPSPGSGTRRGANR